jgi:phosphoglycerol transferase MdoB-like AlkP superfamily enzyme
MPEPLEPVSRTTTGDLPHAGPPRVVRWIFLLALLLLVGLAGLRWATVWYFGRDSDAVQSWAGVYWLGFRYDARVVAAMLLPLLVLGSWTRLGPFERPAGRRLWLSYLTMAAFLLLVVYGCDVLHFRYLNQRLNASVLGFLGDMSISLSMVWQSYPVVWGGLGLILGLWIMLRLVRGTHSLVARSPLGSVGKVAVAWRVGTGALLLFALYGRLGQYPLRWSDAFDLRNDLQANLALNPVQSFISSLSFRASRFDPAKVELHRARMQQYLGVQDTERDQGRFLRTLVASPAPAKRPKNVVLVICESFSVYKSSVGNNPLNTTPFFAELSQQGVLFDHCFTPHFGTARGVWATVTGVPDVELVKTASRNPSLVDQHTLLNELEALSKLYFLGGSSSWANLRGLLTNNIRGLQLHEEGSFRSPRADVWGISDKSLFLEANEILARQTKPFFAVIQTANNHRPYTIPAEDRPFLPGDVHSEAELREAGFESQEELDAFRYTDFTFKTFIEAARKTNYYDETLFVFIGDHGIGGNAGKRFPESWTSRSLTSFHVPLLFYAPRYLEPRRSHAVSSMVDVLPTIAGVLGAPVRYSGLGRDLLRQEQVDGGRSNIAFIIDHNNKSIGVVRGSTYTHRRLDGTDFEVDWANPYQPADTTGIDAQRATDSAWAEAFFETSRYLLHHNKKLPESRAAAGSP